MAEVFRKGEAPWEQNKQLPAGPIPKGQAPWEQNAAVSPAPQEEVIQEQQPDISFKERFVAKNFANSPEAQVAYLKQQHPDLDVKILNDQVVAKKPQDKSYRVLDPSGFDVQDLTDVGYDVGSGAATGLATAAGGIAGAGASLPVLGSGAIPAAAAAGGATSAGLEALRQKLGQYFGVPQQIDYSQVGLSGAAGAVSPMLFGTGATAAGMAKAGLTEAEKQAQRSLVTRALQKGVPSAAESVSGVPQTAIKTLFNRGEDLQQLKQTGISDVSEAAYENLRKSLSDKTMQVGKNLENEIAKASDPANPRANNLIDLTNVKKALNDQIEKLSKGPLAKNPEIMDKVAELKGYQQKIFGLATGELDAAGNPIIQEMPNVVDAKTAFDLQDLLKQQGDLAKIRSFTPSAGNGTKADKEWSIAAQKAYHELNKELDTATEGFSSKFKKDYSDLKQLQRNLDKYFKNPEKTAQTLQGLNAPGKQVLRETLDQVKNTTGYDINPDAQLLEAYRYFNKPSLMPISGSGTTSTSRTGVLGTLGYLTGHYLTGNYQGGLAGAAAANYLSGPKAVMYGTQALSGANKLVGPYLQQYGTVPARGAMPIWNMLNTGEKR